MNRREFLIRSGLMGVGAMSIPAILSACGASDTASDTTGGSPGRSLYFENWPAYIDEETVKLFMAATGIEMKYTEAYNDNNEYFAKVQPLLAKGDKADPDLIAPTFWMASRYVKLGWAQKLPLDKIPNAANLRPDLKNPAWDPNGEFSLPWQTGIAGIAYNTKITGREIKGMADLFAPEFKGKIGMLTEMRDTMGLILMGEGKNIETISTFDEAAVGFEKLEKAKSDGQIRSFTGNDYMDDLNAGNFAACVAWSGDVVQLSRDNPDIKFVIPEEGGTSWYDTMIWLTGSENSDAVAQWINWCYDPVNAARITAFVAYMSPVAGVKDELVKLGGDAAAIAESPLLFPDEATLSRLQTWGPLSEDEEAKFDEAFAKITGA